MLQPRRHAVSHKKYDLISKIVLGFTKRHFFFIFHFSEFFVSEKVLFSCFNKSKLRYLFNKHIVYEVQFQG